MALIFAYFAGFAASLPRLVLTACSNPSCRNPPCAARLLGDVGCTTVSGTETYRHERLAAGDTVASNAHIFGPFEAGFTSTQDNIIRNWGCSDPSVVYDSEGGKDIGIAEAFTAYSCNMQFPRLEGNTWYGVVGPCGGHTSDYHFHKAFACLYREEGSHSTAVGIVGSWSIYGKWEDFDNQMLPYLDACGGHFGRTPESPSADIYHYHVQDRAPFTVGCHGPDENNGLVGILKCRNLYSECGDGDTRQIRISSNTTVSYDLYCPCYDADGSNIGTRELPALSTSEIAYKHGPSVSPVPSPASAPMPRPTPAPGAPAVAPAPASPSSQSGSSSSQPNIIIFQPDDMPFYDLWQPPENPPSKNTRYDLPALPHLSRVRSEGVSFTQAYVVSPACSPSRYATLTGRYAARSEYGREQTLASNSSARHTDTTVPNTKLTGDDCTNNIPSSLKAAGYRTGVAGKWHLMVLGRQMPSYVEQQQSILACGFDWADGIYVENVETPKFASSAGGNWSHNMEWVTERAIDFISTTPSSKPFFLYFNPTVPHSPSTETALRDYSCKRTPSGELATEPSVVGMTRGTTCAAYRNTVISRNTVGSSNQLDNNLGSIWADDALGALLSTLEGKGILDSTAVIFMLDHGMETKMALFENGVRTALSIWYPALFSAGSQYAGQVANIDLAHTVLELAGASPGYQMDGISFLSEVKSATSAGGAASTYWTERCIFFDYELDRGVRCGCNKYISIQTAQSTTLSRAQQNGHPQDDQQLYNLCSDGSEATNIASSASEVRAAMVSNLLCHTARTNPAASPSFAACGPSFPDVLTPSPSPAKPVPSPRPSPSPTPSPTPSPSPTLSPTQSPPTPAPAGTCPTGSCRNNAWFSASLTYQASTGKFSGTLETNQCPFWTQDTISSKSTADCKSVTIGSTTNMPPRGNIGWSVKGVNIYGSFEAGFGNKQTTLENSQATSNVNPPYPCYNAASGKYYGYCDSGVDVASCEESLHAICSGGEADILSDLFMDHCGGHARPYHYHNDPACYYDHTAPGHSPLIGYALDGHGIYGIYENINSMPTDLDACNGHTAPVPANSTYGVVSGTVYHYHTTLDFPFTLGCYGPKTLEQCRAADNDCDGKTLSIYTRNGSTKMIDSYCGCRELPSGQSNRPSTPSPVPSSLPSPVQSSTLPSHVPSPAPSPVQSSTLPSPVPSPAPSLMPSPGLGNQASRATVDAPVRLVGVIALIMGCIASNS
eukprot:TRINITY_DN24214_c0_g1_i1.p1 TRINITY_DN24214_c0_g1~~TRINITY_DN24214_c0_g1_i1.p1  ORF type:complete len:1256 (-),score=115.94 TRINITY_DN24214_c0_g1_i1:366-4064(-)